MNSVHVRCIKPYDVALLVCHHPYTAVAGIGEFSGGLFEEIIDLLNAAGEALAVMPVYIKRLNNDLFILLIIRVFDGRTGSVTVGVVRHVGDFPSARSDCFAMRLKCGSQTTCRLRGVLKRLKERSMIGIRQICAFMCANRLKRLIIGGRHDKRGVVDASECGRFLNIFLDPCRRAEVQTLGAFFVCCRCDVFKAKHCYVLWVRAYVHVTDALTMYAYPAYTSTAMSEYCRFLSGKFERNGLLIPHESHFKAGRNDVCCRRVFYLKR